MAGIPRQRIKTKEQFCNGLQGALGNGGEATYAVLIGAGFSKTAGIPLAGEIAGILAYLKNSRLDKAKSVPSALDAIQAWAGGELAPGDELTRFRERSDQATASDGAIYQELFFDDEVISGKRVGRRAFLSELITAATRKTDGYNFESLYLAYLAQASKERGRSSFTTILTTNFDDVVPYCFFSLGASLRVLDQDALLAAEKGDARGPRIAYLHGRHVNYDLANTSREIADRKKVVRRFLKQLPPNAGLIVIGYSGWEDAVMAGLREVLADNGLAAGVHWCHYGALAKANENKLLVELASKFEGVDIVPETSARDAMRLLLQAAGVAETDVLRTLRNQRAFRLANLEERLSQIGEADLDLPRASRAVWNANGQRPLFDTSVDAALEAARQALERSRSCAVALAMIDSALRTAPGLAREKEAELFRARGELRLRYRRDIGGARVDFQLANKLEHPRAGEVLLGLAEVYALRGEVPAAIAALAKARSQAAGDPILEARCDAIAGRVAFFQDRYDEARSLLNRASAALAAAGDLDWLIKTEMNLVFLDEYLAQFENAESRLLALVDHYRKPIQLSHWKAAVSFAQAKLSLRRDQLRPAARQLQHARWAAEEGPSFEFLGNIALFEAEVAARNYDLAKAERCCREALELYVLADTLGSQLSARLALQRWQAVERQAKDAQFWAAAAAHLERNEAGPNYAEGVVEWARFAFAGFANRERRQLAAGLDLAATRAESCLAGLAAQESLVAAPQQSLFAQYCSLARLLASLTAEPQTAAGALATQLAAFTAAQATAGRFESSEIEVIHAAVTLQLAERGQLPGGSLASQAWPAGEAPSRRAFRAFCRERGYPFYETLAEPI